LAERNSRTTVNSRDQVAALPGHISLLHPVGLALARPAVFFSTSTF
jgi:hypothetical protein